MSYRTGLELGRSFYGRDRKFVLLGITNRMAMKQSDSDMRKIRILFVACSQIQTPPKGWPRQYKYNKRLRRKTCRFRAAINGCDG